MAHLIDKSAVVAEIERLKAELGNTFSDKWACGSLDNILSFLDTLEVREVDLEKEAELIANGIMIGVQSNRYHTVVYNTKRNDFNHSHLMLAARKGIELGLKAQNEGEIVAEEECTCNKMLNRIVGKGLNLICPVYKMNVNNGDKVKVKIIKGE